MLQFFFQKMSHLVSVLSKIVQLTRSADAVAQNYLKSFGEDFQPAANNTETS